MPNLNDRVDSPTNSTQSGFTPSAQYLRAALYTRVSTQLRGQETANQLLQLRECCKAQNWSILREYEDRESGGKSDRTAFQEMLRDAFARRFDILFFWSLDRLTREGTLATLKYLELWRPTAFGGVASRNRGSIALARSATSSSVCWPVWPSRRECGSPNEFGPG
jgi:Resolvase, N terminal domain